SGLKGPIGLSGGSEPGESSAADARPGDLDGLPYPEGRAGEDPEARSFQRCELQPVLLHPEWYLVRREAVTGYYFQFGAECHLRQHLLPAEEAERGGCTGVVEAVWRSGVHE